MRTRLLAAVAVGLVFACSPNDVPTDSNDQYGAIQHELRGVVQRALNNLSERGGEVSVSTSQVVARDVIAESDGTEHVRFDRHVAALRVIGGDLVVHGTSDGLFRGISIEKAVDPEMVDRNPALSAEEAVLRATEIFGGAITGDATAELVINTRGAGPELAYEVVLAGILPDGSDSELHVLVNAADGVLGERWDGIETSAASGTGRSFFSGTVALTTDLVSGTYNLRDPSRGNQYTIDMKNKQGGSGTIFTDADNAWGDGTVVNRQTIGVDAQYGTAVTWDYYLNVHGRNGIRNDGVGAYNRVHYGRNYNNAYWSDSCFCMTYGDGDGVSFNPFDSLDVAGHEMSHGVTSRTANLVYSGESGGLNEATSDIFGSMVEYYAGNALDTGDYKIGEKLYKNNPGEATALRYMYHPSLDGNRSKDCYYSGIGSIDVHYSSGVANHFFYLLAEGSGATPASPTCNGSSVTGIGRSAAERIWFRALTVYMTSSTNYAGARAATLSAASDLFGAGSAQQTAVAAAWSAVSVN